VPENSAPRHFDRDERRDEPDYRAGDYRVALVTPHLSLGLIVPGGLFGDPLLAKPFKLLFHMRFIGIPERSDKWGAMNLRLHEIPEDRIHDAREDSAMFQGLPAATQEEFRDRWRKEERSGPEFCARRRYTWKVYAAEMTGAFVLFSFWTILAQPSFILFAALAGGGVGFLAGLLRAGVLLYPIVAGVGFMASGCRNPFAILAVVSLAALLGRLHHMSRFDGIEA